MLMIFTKFWYMFTGSQSCVGDVFKVLMYICRLSVKYWCLQNSSVYLQVDSQVKVVSQVLGIFTRFWCIFAGCQSNVGDVYKNNETWKEGDCVTCHCVDGKKRCQAEMCVKTCRNPRPVTGRCCPICDGKFLYSELIVPTLTSLKFVTMFTVNVLKFQTLYSILFCLNFAFYAAAVS